MHILKERHSPVTLERSLMISRQLLSPPGQLAIRRACTLSSLLRPLASILAPKLVHLLLRNYLSSRHLTHVHQRGSLHVFPGRFPLLGMHYFPASQQALDLDAYPAQRLGSLCKSNRPA